MTKLNARRIPLALLVSLTATLSLGAMAQADEAAGFYGSVFVGGSFPDTADFDGTIGGNPQSVETDFDTGYVVGGALGRSWGTFGSVIPRTELEVAYRQSDVDGIAFSGNGPAPEVNVNGDSSSTTVFANALVDIPIASGRLKPFAGFGLGIAFTEQDFSYGPGVRVNDSDEVFAAQAIAGVSYALSERLDLTLDGRYQRQFGVESRRLAPNGAVTGVVEDDLDIFSVAVGLRAKF